MGNYVPWDDSYTEGAGMHLYPPGMTRVLIFADAESVARAGAHLFVSAANFHIGWMDHFRVALSGGSTPRRIYELLASEEFASRVAWSKVHVFFGDERCVPPDDEASNYRMARESLLSRVPIPAPNVHRMIGEGDAAANARLYEDELRAIFGDATLPRFDLVMLGLGEDGHTASLFPNSPALDEDKAWVVANYVEKLGAYRLTLTAPVINNAANVMFVAVGAAKAERMRDILEGKRDPKRLPAQLIQPLRCTLDWLVDRAAVSKLEGRYLVPRADERT